MSTRDFMEITTASLYEKKKAECHNRHSENKACESIFVMPVCLGGRKYLINGYVYHYSRASGKGDSKYRIRHDGKKHRPRKKGTKRLCKT